MLWYPHLESVVNGMLCAAHIFFKKALAFSFGYTIGGVARVSQSSYSFLSCRAIGCPRSRAFRDLGRHTGSVRTTGKPALPG